MMIPEIVVTVLVTLIVADVARSSRALASWMARWAAGRVYAGDPERAKMRKGEWGVLVKEDISSDIAALCVGVSFAAFAVACVVGRQVRAAASRAAGAYEGFTADPARPLARGDLIVAIRQQASELRLCLAEAASLPAEADSYRSQVRRLATDLQNHAAAMSRWDRGPLGVAGEALARTALALSDQMFPPGRISPETTQHLTLDPLDECIEAFTQGAFPDEETKPNEGDQGK